LHAVAGDGNSTYATTAAEENARLAAALPLAIGWLAVAVCVNFFQWSIVNPPVPSTAPPSNTLQMSQQSSNIW